MKPQNKENNSILYQKIGDEILWGANSLSGFPTWAVDGDVQTDYPSSETSADVTFHKIDIPMKEVSRLETLILESKEKVKNMRKRLSEICGQDMEMVVWRSMDLKIKNIDLQFDNEKEPLLAGIRCKLDADVAGDILPGSLVMVHIDECLDDMVRCTLLKVLRNGSEGRQKYDYAIKQNEDRNEGNLAMKGKVRYTRTDPETGRLIDVADFHLDRIEMAGYVLPDSLRDEEGRFPRKIFKKGRVYKYSTGKYDNGEIVKDNILFFMHFKDEELGSLSGMCMKKWAKKHFKYSIGQDVSPEEAEEASEMLMKRMPLLVPEGYDYYVDIVPNENNDGRFLIGLHGCINMELKGRLFRYNELQEWKRYRQGDVVTPLPMNMIKAQGSNVPIRGHVVISPVTRNTGVFDIPENTTWCSGAMYAGVIHDDECPQALLAYVQSRVFNPLMKIPGYVYVLGDYVHFEIGTKLKDVLNDIRKKKDKAVVRVMTYRSDTFYVLVCRNADAEFGYPARYVVKNELERQYLLRLISKDCDFTITDITDDGEIVLSLNMPYNEFVKQLGLTPGSLVTFGDYKGMNDKGDMRVAMEYKLQNTTLKLDGIVLKETIGRKTKDERPMLMYLGCDKGILVMACQSDKFIHDEQPYLGELVQLSIIRRIDGMSWLCHDDKGAFSLLHAKQVQSALIGNVNRIYSGNSRNLCVIGSTSGSTNSGLAEFNFISIVAGYDYIDFLSHHVVQLETPVTHRDKYAFVQDAMVVLEPDRELTKDNLRTLNTSNRTVRYDRVRLLRVGENDELICERIRQEKTASQILRYNRKATSAPSIGCKCEGVVVGYGEDMSVLVLVTAYGKTTISDYHYLNIPNYVVLDYRTSGDNSPNAQQRREGMLYMNDLYPMNTKLRLVCKEFSYDGAPIWGVDPTLPACMSRYRLISEVYNPEGTKWVASESTTNNLAIVTEDHAIRALERSVTAKKMTRETKPEITPKRGDYVGLVGNNRTNEVFFPSLDVQTGLLERVLTLKVVEDRPKKDSSGSEYFICQQEGSSDSIMMKKIYEKNPLTFRIRKNEWNWDGAEDLDFTHFKNRVVKARVDSIGMEDGIVYMDRRSLLPCHRDISASTGHCITAVVTGYDDENQNVKLTYSLHDYSYNLTMSYTETDCLGLQLGLYDETQRGEIIRELLPLETVVTAKVLSISQRSLWQKIGEGVISQRQMHPEAPERLREELLGSSWTSMAVRSIGERYIFVKRKKVVFAIAKPRGASFSIGQSVTVRLNPTNRDYVCVIRLG